MNFDIISLGLGLIAAIAAVISAIPEVRRWFPVKLSKKELEILQLAKPNNSYPNIIFYGCGAGKPYVQTPYEHKTSIYVTNEITVLLGKKLLSQIHVQPIGPYIGDIQLVWLMLTKKGLRALKR
ncbi:hypothetical protein ABK988_22585 [Vibrio parahaemolyticus]|nr:hypothetical protein [Vibrio parahaemolyticus]